MNNSLINFNSDDTFGKSSIPSDKDIMTKQDQNILMDIFEKIKDDIEDLDIDIDNIDVTKSDKEQDIYNVKIIFELYDLFYRNYDDLYISIDFELYYEKPYEIEGINIGSIEYVDGEILDMHTNSFDILDDKKETIFLTLELFPDILKKYGDEFLELIEPKIKEYFNQNGEILFESCKYDFNRALYKSNIL